MEIWRKLDIVQSGKIQNNIYILNYPAPFSAGFPHSQDKRAGISKKFVLFFTLFLYISWFGYILSYELHAFARHKLKLLSKYCCPLGPGCVKASSIQERGPHWGPQVGKLGKSSDFDLRTSSKPTWYISASCRVLSIVWSSFTYNVQWAKLKTKQKKLLNYL